MMKASLEGNTEGAEPKLQLWVIIGCEVDALGASLKCRCRCLLGPRCGRDAVNNTELAQTIGKCRVIVGSTGDGGVERPYS